MITRRKPDRVVTSRSIMERMREVMAGRAQDWPRWSIGFAIPSGMAAGGTSASLRIIVLGSPPDCLRGSFGFAMPPAWLQAKLVERAGFEPAYACAGRFTVCCL